MTPPHFPSSILSTAYLPPVSYFFAIAHSGQVLIEQHEAYQKQSWRNRCRILSAAGPEDLSIPVMKEQRRSRPIRDIRIDYSEPWLQHHIRAFSAAYNASAYYDYYADDLLPVLQGRPVFLFDLNLALLEKLLSLLDIHVPLSFTDHFLPPGPAGDMFDWRERIQPKYKGKSLIAEYACEQAYYQVFVNRDPASLRHSGPDRASFIPDLSILDLLCAEGPDAGSYLRI
ncbi:MAG: WbqC family protein [Bacteroidales bacterium]|nr:WbqC family protein [Bacteroidales bacterium]